MNVTFELVAALDVNSFNTLVNERLAQGWKFMQGALVSVNRHEDMSGYGYQYSIPMILESE